MSKSLRFSLVKLLAGLVTVAGFGWVPLASAAPNGVNSASVLECKPGIGHQSEEECACAAALKANSIPALEAFLRKYPLGKNPSACSALALNALSSFGGGGGGIAGGPSHGGYGT